MDFLTSGRLPSLVALLFALCLPFFSSSASADAMQVEVWVYYYGGGSQVPQNDPEADCRLLDESRPNTIYRYREFSKTAYCERYRAYTSTWYLARDYFLVPRTKRCPAGTAFANGECVPVDPPASDSGKPCCGPDDPVGIEEGNPINTAVGNKYQSETDYAGTARGTLAVRRFYNSHQAGKLGHGSGWTMSYSRNIEVTSPYSTSDIPSRTASARAIVMRDDGREIEYLATLVTVGGIHTPPEGEWSGPAWSDWRFYKTDSGYRLENRDGRKEIYDEAGRLVRLESMTGLVSVIEHTGNVTRVTDPFGDFIEFEYGNESRVTAITLPDDGQLHYSHDGSGRLLDVTYPDGASRRYLYEDETHSFALTGIVDENNDRYASYAYDNAGRATLSEHAGGADRVTVSYSAGHTVATLASGETRSRYFAVRAGRHFGKSMQRQCVDCGGLSMREVQRDTAGRPTVVTDDDGGTTQLEYNTRGFVTTRTEAVGTLEQRTITTEWHADFRVPTQITEPDRITSYTYDANGNRLSQTVADMATGESRTTAWTYNQFGQVLTVDGPRTDISDITSYTYDAQGNVSTATNALGQVTRYTDYDAHGNPLRIVDANGVVTELEYDLRQRLVSRTVAAGTANAATTSFTYDAVGQLIEMVLPNGASIHYEYDAAHRLVAIEDGPGNRIDYTLDAMGNRINETVSGPGGDVFRESGREYNTLNRLAASIGGAGQRTTYAYDADGNRTGSTDAASNTTTQHYDALDRLFETVDALGGITQYHYDPSDNLTQVVDPRGVTTGYTYNGFSELTETASPDAGTTTYAYDKAGNRISQTDARGITVHYAYDALNRLVFIDYPEPADGSPSQDITYTYDDGPNGVGRLTEIRDESGETAFFYGPRGTLVNKVATVDGVTLPVDYGYDAADQLSELRYPSGHRVQYERDAAGRVTALEYIDTAGSRSDILAGIAYAPFGPATALTYGNGIAEQRVFDRDGRITHIQGGVLDTVYEWDATGNITAISDQLDPDDSQLFGYDGLYRLTQADGDYGNIGYDYDAVGNRLLRNEASGSASYTYEATSNRLAGITGTDGTTDYDYDAAGNTLADGNHGFVYDARNRLVETYEGENLVGQYTHNALGQRVSKTAGTAPPDYLGMAEEQDALAAQYRSEAGTLTGEAADLRNTADSLDAQAETAEAEAQTLRQTATEQRTQAGVLDTDADAIEARAQPWQERARRFRDRIQEPPGNFIDRILNGVFGAIAGFFQSRADSLHEDAAAQRAEATNLRQQADANDIAADEQQALAAAWRSEAGQARADAAALENDAAALLAQADAADALAAEYRQLAENPPTTVTTTLFAYDEAGHLIGEYDESGEVIREYIWLGDRPVAMIDGNGSIHYIHVDHLNTPKVVTDENQAVVWKGNYTPFGKVEEVVSTVDMPLRFPGQYYDVETGLNYNYFRSYNPATGRYTQTDPYGLAGQQFVLYGYVSNNPVDRFDRYGLETCGSDGNEGLVPDNPLGFQFSSCCEGHDACYGTCGKAKSECDTEFKNCMQKKCELANYSITHSICMQTADTYWAAVVNDGGEAYKNAQEEACKDGDCSSGEDST